jgi:hypothetical protein
VITEEFNDESVLMWLQQWYSERCDGEWEHSYGIEISTLDNPGWQIKVDLRDTGLEEARFENVTVERAKTDWIRCSVGDKMFRGACGPLNLTELLGYFRSFADKARE